MYTAFVRPLHATTQESDMPARKDEIGARTFQFRRQVGRPLGIWEIEVPALQEELESFYALLESIQGDTPIWFDGAGFAEKSQPVLIGIGDGSRTDFGFLHRHVFAASVIIYVNGAVVSGWTALGGDGIVVPGVRLASAPSANAQVTACYRYKVKVVVETEQSSPARERAFYAANGKSVEHIRIVLNEVLI